MVRFAAAVLALALLSLSYPAANAQSGALVGEGHESCVYITGEVSKPGKYPLAGSMTVVQLVALSGGLQHSSRAQLIIVDGTVNDADGNPVTRSVNFQDILTGKDLARNNVKLRAGDVVIVRFPPERR